MTNSSKQIFFFLAKLPLLFIYISFFFVQLFYNFDISGRISAKDALQKTVKTGNIKTKAVTVKKTSQPTGNTVSFRLNKRYHPQPAITCNTVVYKPQVCYVSSKQHVHYSSGFVPSSFPPAHSLRGPPAVV